MAMEVRSQVESKKMLWTGRILSWVITVLLLMDAMGKLLQLKPVMEGTVHAGYTADSVRPIGIILLLCLICYVIPRTSVLGAILLTGYLGSCGHQRPHPHSAVLVRPHACVCWSADLGRIGSPGPGPARAHSTA